MRKLICLLALSSFALFGQFSNAKKLQGRLICIDAPSDGNTLTWSASRVCWVAASAGSGSQSIQVDGVAIGTRATVNFITAAGITWTAADTGLKINLTPAVDTAYIPRHLDVASGVDLSVTPASNSGTTYTGCQASITPTLTTGMVVHLIPDHNSTGGATTFNYCGGGALALKQADGATALTATDLVTGVQQDIWYDGSIWRLKVTAPAPAVASGTSITLAGLREFVVCTSTCTVTPPVPVAGAQYCVRNGNNVSTVITLAALGSSARYENSAHTAYGTAGTGTFISGGAVGDSVCLVGLDSTHYLTMYTSGTWTAN